MNLTKFKMPNDKLIVANSQKDLAEVTVVKTASNFMLEIEVNYFEDHLENDWFTVDTLNETVPQFLIEEGFEISPMNRELKI